MASIMISESLETPSVVNVGEEPVVKTTLIMGERTKQALINLVNERREILRKRVPAHVPVVGPVTSIEEALLDIIGGIGAAGGSSWFRRNFMPETLHFESSTSQEPSGSAHSLVGKE